MGLELLTYYKTEWERYTSAMVKVNRMFHYLVISFINYLIMI